MIIWIDNESLWAIFGTIMGTVIGSYFTYLYMSSYNTSNKSTAQNNKTKPKNNDLYEESNA